MFNAIASIRLTVLYLSTSSIGRVTNSVGSLTTPMRTSLGRYHYKQLMITRVKHYEFYKMCYIIAMSIGHSINVIYFINLHFHIPTIDPMEHLIHYGQRGSDTTLGCPSSPQLLLRRVNGRERLMLNGAHTLGGG